MSNLSNPNDTIGQIWEDQIIQTNGYNATLTIEQLNRFVKSPYIQLIKKYCRLKEYNLVLEPGCGSGKFSFAFALQGHKVITLDYTSVILRRIQETQKILLPYFRYELTLDKGDLEHLPYMDNSFDLVMNEGVVEHWLDKDERVAVLKEMVRVTKPGGNVAILVPNGVHPLIKTWDKKILNQAPPMTYYSASCLKSDLIEAGLEDIKTDGIYAFRSWVRLGQWQKLYNVSAILDKIAPLPRRLREKWAMNLIALGIKPIKG